MKHYVMSGMEAAFVFIEGLGVIVIVGGVSWGVLGYLRDRLRGGFAGDELFQQFRLRMGRALLLGLEMLVAADVIRTVAIEPTLSNAALLGVIVLIRTFISWTLVLDLENRWPWQAGSRDVTS
ncbi:MAG: DUF1622 domain-containing protein [Verrucomicrobiota bacterium]